MRESALQRAIDYCKGPHALGRKLGCTGQAVSQWKRAPAERVVAIEAACEGTVTREELRPDLYRREVAA